MTDDRVRLEQATAGNGRGYTRVVLSRPEARNAFDNAMAGALHAACRSLAADPDTAFALVQADGPVFCAGADIKERGQLNEDGVRARRLRGFRAYASLESLPMPVVCVVDGPCIGSGCEIALACDFIMASDRARFRVPEARWGTVGATQRLSRAIGLRRARELMFTGRYLDAAEARDWGLVNRVVPADALTAEIDALIEEVAAAPPHALRLAKRAMNRGYDDSRHGALAHELWAIEDNLEGGDWRSGMSRALDTK